MFLFHVFTSLGFPLITIHLFLFLLNKLFTFLLHRATSKGKGDIQLISPQIEDEASLITGGSYSVGEEGLLFFYSESVYDTLLISEERDSKEKEHHSLKEEEENFVSESPYVSPHEDFADKETGISFSGDQQINDAGTPPETPISVISTPDQDDVLTPKISSSCEDTYAKSYQNDEEKHNFTDSDKLFVVKQSHSNTIRFELEYADEDKENYGGSLTCESTSKSSMEWRSSAILRDSETEHPFSSSSRRSSSNWESFTLFRKYDEEMMFFDRISAQKLRETESFRSIKFQPRSISQRIVHKLMTKQNELVRNTYQELENAYVAQICLAWEALNWNYSNFQRSIANRDRESHCCSARIAQEFQQFQVLLQRFIENEPYEHGRRPEVFARIRICSPKLLQVPEFRVILEDAILTFMNFLKSDKENPCQILKAFMKKKSSSVDLGHLHLLKKANKKKKMRLKDLVRRRKCLKKRKVSQEQEMEITMGLIDMKVVSRVLRMAGISQDQLHWCEEKMTKLRVWDGKLQRDSSPLFYPVH